MIVSAVLATLASSARAADFIEFESGPVRPIALSASGTSLYVVNTPDNRLEVFNVGAGGISKAGSVDVGMEPVSVAIRNAGEVWVVNHLSDSISIVDVASSPPRVTRTLLVGDEPRDLVFAGTGGNRAFITTAHRGQQRTDPSLGLVPGAGDPQLTTPGVNRADIWVFDATNLGANLGGTPVQIVTLFGDTPRALAVSPSGDTVYAAIFHSGNQTTTVSEGMVCNGFNPGASCQNGPDNITTPGGNPGPPTDHLLNQAPEVGLIVKWDGTKWRDEDNRNWNNAVLFSLPDRDVFALDANTLAQTTQWSGVGTILFNMAVNPTSGKVYVSNAESKNEVRFEGPGIYAAPFKPGGEPATVQGHLAEYRVTVLDGAAVNPRHLNKHINYSILPAPAGTAQKSLATPLDMAVSPNGQKLYVAAFGSSKIGVFDTTTLENNTFDPATQSGQYIPVTGGGPGGLALDAARNRLYVLTRFDNSVSVVDLGTSAETAHVALFNPEPAAVTQGRFMLYDAQATSSNGEASCSSCHIFGDMDDLAWDLGNPDDAASASPFTPATLVPLNLDPPTPKIRLAFGAPANINGTGVQAQFSALKGPMTTQTLRGMVNAGAMHWRGDRSNGCLGISATSEDLNFRNFIVAFPGLVGMNVSLNANCTNAPTLASDMQKFANFQLSVQLPPNPNRAIDNSLTPAQQNGKNFYNGAGFNMGPALNPHLTGVGGPLQAGRNSDGVNFTNAGFNCNGCHTLNPASGFFGTDGNQSFENEPQFVKIAHLRNAYQKVGMYGMPDVDFNLETDQTFQGDQIRGFGYLHDGSTDTVFQFLQATVFSHLGAGGTGVGFAEGPNGDGVRRDVEAFVLGFDTDFAPAVGQQVTLTSTNSGVAVPRISTLVARAAATYNSQISGATAKECDLVVKGTIGGVRKGWVGDGAASPTFTPDDGGAAISLASLQGQAVTPGQELTFTCVTPGAGTRAGINRDRDAANDGVDNCPDVFQASQADADSDGRGDVCDNCAAKSNGTQVDTDADGVGNLCDNQCIGPVTVTTLAGTIPASAGVGTLVEVTGTGIGPSAVAMFDGIPATIQQAPGVNAVQVPAGLAEGPHTLTVVNPEGCQSQENVSFTVTAPASCGLIGIEPFALLAGLRVARRLRRRVAA
jgi:DNA-binding beta-propeller fold protein YncE